MKAKYPHPEHRNVCRHVRLAESSLAAIDRCACGMLQLHIGSMTLRMAPCAAAELLATLQQALAQNIAECGAEIAPGGLSFRRPPRGEA